MYKKDCAYCGKEFMPVIGPQIYCSRECCVLAKRKRDLRNRKKIKVKTRERKRSVTLDEILKEIEEYNKKHGTFISYGQYMSMRNSI